jgi:hypothetical protein
MDINYVVIEWINGDLEVYRADQVAVHSEYNNGLYPWEVCKVVPTFKQNATVNLGHGIKKIGPIKRVTVYWQG